MDGTRQWVSGIHHSEYFSAIRRTHRPTLRFELMLPIEEIYPLIAVVSGEIWKLGSNDSKENMKMATEP